MKTAPPAPSHIEFRKLVGGRLQEARKKKEMTLDGVGQALGVSKQAVGHWENGVNPIKLDDLYRLARLYGSSVASLVAENLEDRDLIALLEARLTQTDQPAQPEKRLKSSGGIDRSRIEGSWWKSPAKERKRSER